MDAVDTKNQKSPAFVAKDIFGSEVDLTRVDKDYTLLVFLRYAGCPWCNLAIHRLTIEYKRLQEASCQVVAIVQSDSDSIKQNIYDRHVPQPQFPIIPDHEMRLYKEFGVSPSLVKMIPMIKEIPYWLQSVLKLGYKQGKIDGNFFMVPAWFLVNNRNGNIVRSERGSSFYDPSSFVSIYDALQFKDE